MRSTDAAELAALLIVAALLSALLAYFGGQRRDTAASRRMKAFVRDHAAGGPEGEERRPFSERVLRPILTTLAQPLLALTPRSVILTTRLRLTHAGLGLGAAEFIGLELGGAAVGLTLGVLAAAGQGLPAWLRVLAPFLGAAFGYSLPGFIVGSAATRRQKVIRRGLAPTLEVLSISMEAGLAFDGAIAHVAQQFGTPLSDELRRMFIEFQMGRTRRQALEDFAARIGIVEVDRFVQTVVQGESMGVPLSKALSDQAIELRQAQRQRAEGLARTAPIKMMLPLVLLTLPALFMVILGPTVAQLLSGGLF